MFDDDTMNNQHLFVNAMLAVAANHDISVTSWGRTQKHNDALPGSVKNSQHIQWLACDVVLDDWSKRTDVCNMAHKLGLVAIDEGNHIHLQWPR